MTVRLDDADQAREIFGLFDRNIGLLEDAFNVRITLSDTEIRIAGEEENCRKAGAVIEKLVDIAKSGQPVTPQSIHYLVELAEEDQLDKLSQYLGDTICFTTSGRPIKPKTYGQKKYVDEIRKNTVTLGIGPAGTGKTFLAVALAVADFKNKQVNRIVLTRPAVEAGEKLGFLPGDLQNKVDPYLRPLYDALREMLGLEVYQRHIEKGLIEVAPLAYMRGRTLDDSFIILDEAQNTTPEQMKMFLTRIGFNSKAVVNGDITQIDLPPDKRSGLKEVIRILRNIEGIGMVQLTEKDVVRHELVQRIIKAYEAYEARKR
ncbi:MAG TPA: phosphate starvation-inducible protein PhoH [Clostridiales bacterium]|nr:phosphate starvation-inducible protein PhoH [Clostridiales bacterium]